MKEDMGYAVHITLDKHRYRNKHWTRDSSMAALGLGVSSGLMGTRSPRTVHGGSPTGRGFVCLAAQKMYILCLVRDTETRAMGNRVQCNERANLHPHVWSSSHPSLWPVPARKGAVFVRKKGKRKKEKGSDSHNGKVNSLEQFIKSFENKHPKPFSTASV